VFSERAGGRAPPPRDLALIVDAFNDAVARIELVLERERMTPRQRDGENGLEIARLQTALSAVSLLTSDRGMRVKECADDRGCGWLFVDTTRNGSRRFCFSNECGNRARQAAFRHRHRDPASPFASVHDHTGGAT
jgi:predicted RNA-binding Zn ribbon-like protein